MVMRKVNGYSIAVRLCEYFCRTGLSFPLLCKVFGPLYWEHLSALEKLYFKRVALQYRMEWHCHKVTDNQFVGVIFDQRREELEHVREALKVVGERINSMNTNELIALFK